MAKTQTRRSISASTEGYALVSKLSEHPAYSGRTWDRGTPGSVSNTLELLVRERCEQLGISLTPDEIAARTKRYKARSKEQKQHEQDRLLADAFGERYTG